MHGSVSRIAPVVSPVLQLPGITHAFFTREGGVSTGIYAGLNTGTGSQDDRTAVLENRARAAAWLGVAPDRLVTPHQIHSPDAVAVEEVWSPGHGPKADALVTRRPGIAIGVGSADCGPVLFADAESYVVGAAHSGWKGAFTGVLEATVGAMETLGARRETIRAALGPTISSAAYEVGPEFVARFDEQSPGNGQFFRPSGKPGHSYFDLPGYITSRLFRLGLAAVDDVALCTYADEARFFSYRRATHRGEARYGTLLAAIAIEER